MQLWGDGLEFNPTCKVANPLTSMPAQGPYGSADARKDWIPKTIKRTPPESATCITTFLTARQIPRHQNYLASRLS
uniref:Uncharacterized protein n=1 Tax=Rhizophora mucronata TaxID=61149 RepID=A0A2P2JQT4_RHIMU